MAVSRRLYRKRIPDSELAVYKEIAGDGDIDERCERILDHFADTWFGTRMNDEEYEELAGRVRAHRQALSVHDEIVRSA
jgi:hypothetical protein